MTFTSPILLPPAIDTFLPLAAAIAASTSFTADTKPGCLDFRLWHNPALEDLLHDVCFEL
jgi:hypothetical protein